MSKSFILDWGSSPQYLDPHLANSVSAHNVIISLIEGLVSEDPKTHRFRKVGVAKWTFQGMD